MAKASTTYVDTPVRDALATGPLCNGSGVDMGASKRESRSNDLPLSGLLASQ
jgi:hypothetical protein